MENILTLSLIIPVYNEENHLRPCLESIASQTVKPDEVIVVDNNSTDATVEIAKSYDFVTVIYENEQGLIPARNTGFRASKGELIGRLDADSILATDWVETVKKVFADDDVHAITGPAKTFIESHLPWLTSTLWSRVYFWHALTVFRFQILWGPNMAVRRKSWQEIADELCTDDRRVHEDQDMSVILKAHGFPIRYLANLLIETDGRRQAYLPKAFEYQRRKQDTIALHKHTGTLQKAQAGGVGRLKAFMISLALLPLAAAFGLFCGIYTIEKLLGLRQ